MAEVLNVKLRNTRGKRHARRLRAEGAIPAVLYGHGEKTVSLQLAADEVTSVLRHGGHVVDLAGAVKDKALVKLVQWDTYGLEVLHLDLARVSEHEKVRVRVAVELRGEAAGIREGGVVDQFIHELEIECPAVAIPDKLAINVNDLHLGKSLSVADISVPPEVRILADPANVVVDCHEPKAEVEVAPVEVTSAEPEVIGRAEKEEEAEE
jgi:large subunit ribosomal protein L25